MSKTLVTGASGLLGAQVVKDLVKLGHEVFAVCRKLPGTKVEGAEYIQVDFESEWDVGCLPKGIVSIIHLAQSDQYRSLPNGAISVIRVNLLSTARLLQFANQIGCKSFVYASSGSVYAPSLTRLNEESLTKQAKDLDAYVASKLSSESLCNAYSQVMTTVVLRPFFIYGRGQDRRMLLPRIYDLVKSQKHIDIQGSEGMLFNPIHVEDAAIAVVAAAQLGDSFKAINISGPEEVTIKGIAQLAGLHLGIEPLFRTSADLSPMLVSELETQSQTLGVPRLPISERIRDLSEDL